MFKKDIVLYVPADSARGDSRFAGRKVKALKTLGFNMFSQSRNIGYGCIGEHYVISLHSARGKLCFIVEKVVLNLK